MTLQIEKRWQATALHSATRKLQRSFWLFLFLCFSGLHADDYVFFSPQMISTHLESYNANEKEWIAKDLDVVQSVCFQDAQAPNEERAPLYIATAGGPGARKSTILERFIAAHPEWNHFVYLDPDQRALRFMVHTYYSRSLNSYQYSMHNTPSKAVEKAYEKWRGASNYITLTLLEDAFRQRFDIVHGTTSTGAHTPAFLQAVKKAGYKVILILCYCEDELRREAIRYRDEVVKFCQSSPEDAVVKGKLFSLRMPYYFAYADELYLFWSDSLTQERLAASYANGKFCVNDSDALELFIDKFQRDRAMWQKEGIIIPDIFTSTLYKIEFTISD